MALQVLPGRLPIHLNEPREVQTVAVSHELFSEFCAAHLSLIGISEAVQVILTIELNKGADSIGGVVLQEFINLLLIVRVFCLNGFGLVDLSACL